MTEITGVHLQPWARSDELIGQAEYAAGVFDTIWLAQQLQSRNSLTLLGALAARVDASVGSCVTFPIGQHPIEVANAFGALTEIVGPDKQAILGLGTGGAMVGAVADIRKPLTRVREMIAMCRTLWAGEQIAMSDYPATVSATDLREDARFGLNFRPASDIPIIVTGIGPMILEIAGELADGILFASNFPGHSLGAFRSGNWGDSSHIRAVEKGLARNDRSAFRRIYGLNISVSEDRDAANAVAKRQAALIVGNKPAELLNAVGIDAEACQPVQQAITRGEGLEAAAELMPLSIANELVISGSPDDVIPPLVELLGFVDGAGFEEAYIGSPLGPDTSEALKLLADKILPALR